MKGLTDIPGIKVGHASDFDALTGCTVVLCERGAVAGIDVRGSATGLEETGLLDPGHVTPAIHAVVLSGGSAFGLEACSGVRRHLERRGIGFQTAAAVVPLVAGAILYDLGIGKANVRPGREMGEVAAAAAGDGAVAEGCVGAGTGATVGKVLGMQHAMKGGVGSYTVALTGGVLVSALVAVNALGDVIDPASGKTIAGARTAPDAREFAGAASRIKQGLRAGFTRENTTLAVVGTNARLDKVQATKLAQAGQIGMVRAISPANTMSDGDVVFGLSHGDLRADMNALCVGAAEAVSEAILRAVRKARTLGGVPGLAG